MNRERANLWGRKSSSDPKQVRKTTLRADRFWRLHDTLLELGAESLPAAIQICEGQIFDRSELEL
eukprot:1465617-Amphidinium_carterae.1